MGYYYVNPLGEVKDISYNFLQNIKEDSLTREAQLEDGKLKYKSQNVIFILWSIFASLFLLMLILYLRKVRRM
jgi:hypothetical protein|uniref:Uncharacterized protein n=1 Tax=viral metagenome TaxID=1070528 RepID=A0A6C0D4K7_9ZZZZ